MARRGRVTVMTAGALSAALLLLAALEWRPLARGWYIRELGRHPGRLSIYLDAPGTSVIGEATKEYVRSEAGGEALLALLLEDELQARRILMGPLAGNVHVRIQLSHRGVDSYSFADASGIARVEDAAWALVPELLGRTIRVQDPWRTATVRKEGEEVVVHLVPGGAPAGAR